MDCPLLAAYEATGQLSEQALAELTDEEDSSEAGKRLYHCFRQRPNIAFARALLTTLSTRYVHGYTHGGPTTTQGLRLAGYLIGLHGDVRDALALWRTKQLTFDTACEFDIQMVAFAGIDPTIAYLQTLPDPDAAAAVDYLQQCQAAGDFDDLHAYFSPDNLPYWI
ncbi:hypothetical protein JAO73_07560 [Hymenobacter sp. BT523]|uniref:hypothetical protein n=1 Tax=Hymenobacter sp. BT523 TaxID=2795725 RepID=UPI0018EE2008|nr:hypothetical protein [Hymenobacter sp. BT523]MBJ6108859.1 hypothetical protein [Hymenobacter sp. BT523]